MTTACETTTTAFLEFGIDDGTDLIHRTHYRLLDTGEAEFEPHEPFFDRLTRSFRTAFVRAARVPTLPTAVDAAVADAAAATANEFLDDPEADLRTDVLPAFYRRAAGFHCTYRDSLSTEASVEFVPDGDRFPGGR